MSYARISLVIIHTAAEWAASSQVLNTYEAGLESDTGLIKRGDGINLYPALSYLSWGSGGSGGDMLSANNLSDVASASASRVNIMPFLVGNTGKFLKVNAGETDMEWTALAGGGDLLSSNNLSDLTSAPTALTNLGGTPIGKNIFGVVSASAVRYIRVNADDSITLRSASNFLSDIGGQPSGSYLTSESDPVFSAWLAGPPNISEFTNDTGFLTGESDPVFTSWYNGADAALNSLTANYISGQITEEVRLEHDIRLTPEAGYYVRLRNNFGNAAILDIYTISQDRRLVFPDNDGTFALTSDLGGFITSESDPIFTASSAFGIAGSDITNWNTSYTNRITSLTVTGSSGASTLIANTLNVPTYTLAGLGGQPLNSNLTTIAGLTPTTDNFMVATASAWASRTPTQARAQLGLGTLATQSGTFSGTSSGTNTGDQTTVSGNAGTATALQTARSIGGVSFDGTADVVPQTIQSVNEATDTTCFPLFITASGSQSLQPKNNAGFIYNSNTNALTAATFIGALSGNASTASSAATLTTPRTIGGVSFDGSGNIVPQTIQSINEATDTTCFPLFISASGSQSLQPLNNAGFIYNSNANALTATTFIGALTGNATSATSAATLTTPRAINGVNFNGSAAITLTLLPNSASTSNTVTFTSADYGTVFLWSPSGTATATLPANGAAAGSWFDVLLLTAQTITISAATADTLITLNDTQADSVAFSTAGSKIGALVRFVSNGTAWIAVNLSNHTMTVAT